MSSVHRHCIYSQKRLSRVSILIEYSQIVEYYGYIKDTFKDAMTKLIFYVSVYGPEHF